jgi:hypothetical protein
MARKTKWTYPVKHYVGIFGVSERTLKTASSQGINLDDESAVRGWLASHRSGGPRQKSPRPVDKPTDHPKLSVPPELMEGRGLEPGIERLKFLEVEVFRSLVRAIDSGDALEIKARRQDHLALLDALRKSEKEGPSILLERKSVVPLSEIQSDAAKLWNGLVSRLQTIPDRGMQTLVGLDALDIRAELKKEIDQALQQIKAYLSGLSTQGNA